jgi:hypothetical protein
MEHLTKILTVKELSAILRKNERWVYANAGKLGAVKISGSWIFTEGGLVNAISTGKQMEGSAEIQRREVVSKDMPDEKRGNRMGAPAKRTC